MNRLRLKRRARDLLLLPVALLVVLLEDVVWRGAHALLEGVSRLHGVGVLRHALSRLPGWAALPLFLIPEAAGRLGELWAATLLYRGHIAIAVLAYVLVRIVGTLVVVFIWQACHEALMRLPWFARLVRCVTQARDWALARVAPARALVQRLRARSRGGIARRVRALRHRLLVRWRALRH